MLRVYLQSSLPQLRKLVGCEGCDAGECKLPDQEQHAIGFSGAGAGRLCQPKKPITSVRLFAEVAQSAQSAAVLELVY